MKMSRALIIFATVLMTTTPNTIHSLAETEPQPLLKLHLDETLRSQATYDVQNGTVYLPVWYIGRVWDSVGGIARWDG
jgi:hypothetical protein